jgi:6-phosphogluconolactonase
LPKGKSDNRLNLRPSLVFDGRMNAYRPRRLDFVKLALIALVAGLAPAAAWAAPANSIVYVGTYTKSKSKGIYAFRFDGSSGGLTPIGLVTETRNPSFLAIHPNHKYLFAANEIGDFEGKREGAVTSFSIDSATGTLTPINQRTSGGDGPCHMSVDKAGTHVLVANYNGGNASVIPVGADGRLGALTAFQQHKGSSVHPQRQKEPHAHSINLDAANHFAFVADLGMDKIMTYRYDTRQGTLTPNVPPSAAVAPGSGPRHFAFHPGGKFAYVINEITYTVTTFAYDEKTGALTELQTIPTVEGKVPGNSTAEVQVHPSGKFLYGSNRGHNSIAVFSIDPAKGTLSWLQNQSTHGRTPRNFGIDPTGAFLLAANQDSDNLVVFRIDPATGRLTHTGLIVEAPTPVCVKFLPVK